MDYLFNKKQLMDFAEFCVKHNCANNTNYIAWISMQEEKKGYNNINDCVLNINFPCPYRNIEKCLHLGWCAYKKNTECSD